MKNKKRNFGIGLIMAAIGIVILGANQTVSASANSGFLQSFSIITVIALLIILASILWLYFLSFK